MPIKCLKTDRGGEFNSIELNDFFQTAWSEEIIDHSLYPTAKWSGRTQKWHCGELGKSYADREESV